LRAGPCWFPDPRPLPVAPPSRRRTVRQHGGRRSTQNAACSAAVPGGASSGCRNVRSRERAFARSPTPTDWKPTVHKGCRVYPGFQSAHRHPAESLASTSVPFSGTVHITVNSVNSVNSWTPGPSTPGLSSHPRIAPPACRRPQSTEAASRRGISGQAYSLHRHPLRRQIAGTPQPMASRANVSRTRRAPDPSRHGSQRYRETARFYAARSSISVWKRSMSRRITSRLPRQKSGACRSMPKRAARVAASARPVDASRSS